MGTPTHFTIYSKGAGKAKPEVHFTGAAKGEAVRDFEIIDNHDYSYTVRYTAVQQVKPAILIIYNRDDISTSSSVSADKGFKMKYRQRPETNISADMTGR